MGGGKKKEEKKRESRRLSNATEQSVRQASRNSHPFRQPASTPPACEDAVGKGGGPIFDRRVPNFGRGVPNFGVWGGVPSSVGGFPSSVEGAPILVGGRSHLWWGGVPIFGRGVPIFHASKTRRCERLTRGKGLSSLPKLKPSRHRFLSLSRRPNSLAQRCNAPYKATGCLASAEIGPHEPPFPPAAAVERSPLKKKNFETAVQRIPKKYRVPKS